jgi:hypothetical protein
VATGGPTFWIGGSVTDPHSPFGQAFLELQLYSNSLTTGCVAGGGFNVTYDPNVYTACSPVSEVSPHGNAESADFNAMLTGSDPGTSKDFGQANQFQQQDACASPADGSPQYCSTVLH